LKARCGPAIFAELTTLPAHPIRDNKLNSFGTNNNLAKGIAMNTVPSIVLCTLAAAALLSACGSSNPPPTTVVSSEVVVPERVYGVIESIQLVQVVPPPAASGPVTGTPVAPTHSTYQIGVRLNQGGYQVFTQDDAGGLAVGQQVRIEHGIVRQS
jgi:hypothetical protein